MRPRRLWLILIGVLVLVALIVAVLRRDPEPSYGGRSLSEWLARLAAVPDGDPPQQAQAAAAIRQIGTNALPYLLKWIQYKPLPWTKALNRITGGLIGKYDFLSDYKNAIRAEQAMEAFRALGPGACAAIPQLLRLMNDPSRSWSAGRAASVIVRMGTNARPALPALIRLLTNTNPWAAFGAVTALGDLTLEPQLVVPALAPCLLSSNFVIRLFAAHAFGCFGGEARGAVPALLLLLDDPYPDIQFWATNALWAIDPQVMERLNARAADAGQKAE